MNNKVFGKFEQLQDVEKIKESDIKYSTEMCRWILKPLGVWPSNSKLFFSILIIIYYFFISFSLIPMTLYAFFGENDINLRLKCIGPINFCLVGMCKYTILLLKKKNISDCIDHINYDWNQAVSNHKDRKVMITKAKLGRLIIIICTTFMASGIIFYQIIIPVTAPRIITPDNKTIRPFGYPVYQPLIPVKYQSVIHLVIDIVQLMGGITAGTIAIGTFSISAVFALHSCGQYDIVNLRILNFVDKYQIKNNISNKETAEIVELQIRILTFIQQIENILNEACLFEFLSSTTGICVILFYLMTEIQQAENFAVIAYFFLLSSYVFNIFILSYIGEKLSQQAQDVGSTVCLINWYELPPKTVKNFILILLMSKYPNTLTAGKIIPLCYSTFCGIIKTALAYLNILRAVV